MYQYAPDPLLSFKVPQGVTNVLGLLANLKMALHNEQARVDGEELISYE